MKKQFALVLALGATVLATGCGWMTCNKSKDGQTTEKTVAKEEVKKDETKTESSK
jgi:hypothetical protein